MTLTGTRVGLLLLVACFVASAAVGQPVVDETIDLDFDRPEAWAMKRFATIFTPTAMTPPGDLEGTWFLGLELVSIPHLNETERTVGFNGIKEEDLNKTAAYARGRLMLDLPADWSLTATYLPPVEVEGVKPNVWSLSVHRSLFRTESTSFEISGFGSDGKIRSSFTCFDRVLEDGAENPFGCESLSTDDYNFTVAGLELRALKEIAGMGNPTLHLGVVSTWMDLEFHVNARRVGFIDRTRLLSSGWVPSVAGGASWNLQRNLIATAEVLYAPLAVERPEDVGTSDDLLHVRVLLAFRPF